jgi:DNA repair exonuclease SbcCD nuclease subunit
MRIGFVADSHFVDGPLFEATQRVHDWIVQDMQWRGVDLALHGGDVYDSPFPSISEQQAAFRFFQHLAEVCPVMVVRGNHDSAAPLSKLELVNSTCQVVVEPGAGLHKIWTRKGHAWVLGVSWNEPLPKGPIEVGVRAGAPIIVLGHLLVRGAWPSSGQAADDCHVLSNMPASMLRKGYVETLISDLRATRSDLVLLGHIHARQEWRPRLHKGRYAGPPILYSGSPMRLHPDEIEPKGYVVADVQPGREVYWARIEVPRNPMRK